MRLAALLTVALVGSTLPLAGPALAEVRIVPPQVDPALAAVIAGPQRSEANRARDVYRHPAATLTFFGLKPTMTVVEITPAGGWYTEILAPYLRDRGRYIAAGSWGGTPGGAKSVASFKAKLDADPGSYRNVQVTSFTKDHYDIAPRGSADMVLSFREIHNYFTDGFAPAAFAAFYAALKPGGVLGIVEHRAPEIHGGGPRGDERLHEGVDGQGARRRCGVQVRRRIGDQLESEGHPRLSQGRLDPAADL